MKKVLSLSLVVIVLIVGSFLYFKSSSKQEAVPTMSPEQVLTDKTEANDGITLYEPSSTPVAVTPDATATTTPSTAAKGQTKIVDITDVGFSPDTLTVLKGTTVKFVNNGQANHQPVSGANVLPGFGATEMLPTGGEYSYVFQQAGSWSYQDQLFPNLKGTVIVE